MKTTEHQGKRVLHVDGAGISHNGVIVGMSNDGFAYYVKSDLNTGAEWDFTVKATLLPVLLKNAKLSS